MIRALKRIRQNENLSIEDILPSLPGDVSIDDLKDDICSTLEDYEAKLKQLKLDIKYASESANVIRNDISQLDKRFSSQFPFVKLLKDNTYFHIGKVQDMLSSDINRFILCIRMQS